MNLHQKKVALVTSSTHGIGKAIIIELAKLDFSVVIKGATTEKLSEEYRSELNAIYREDIESRTLYIQADISKKEERIYLLNSIKKNFHRLDVLVNNAGVAPISRKDILETTKDSYDRVMAINLKGPYFLTQSVANWMIQLKQEFKENYNPYIINISSINHYTSSTNRGEYCLSKAGMNMMTKLFGNRLADFGIYVYEISPGLIDTPMAEKVHEQNNKLIENGIIPIKRWGKPEDVAKPVVAIVNGLLPFSTGTVIDIDGGFHIHRL
jgi:NAD(P)-dependent dehydrogenase (short-subunit alcohol dehydrogenase family)